MRILAAAAVAVIVLVLAFKVLGWLISLTWGLVYAAVFVGMLILAAGVLRRLVRR